MLNLFGGVLFKLESFVLIGLIVLSQAQSPFASDLQPLISKEQLEPIAAIVDKAIRESKIPGAVLLIGNQEKVVYRRAFGFRTLVPKKLPMAEDTIFDIASLTKVIATTTAVMQLVEEGKLQLDAPVALYWPAFKANGKSGITVRQLLTHYSGLQPDLELKHKWSGYSKAMKMIVAERPVSPPGTSYIYSDINFEILGNLVQRVSGKPLDVYCAEHIFKPLGMKNTFFNPPMSLRNRIAPTQYQNGKNGKLLWGEVHDPTAHRMGGVAGHAGLFSTAYDLARFANMLLCGGSFKGARVLTTATIDIMTLPQTPPESMPLRGLGWNIDAPFGSNRNTLFPIGSFGHKGYTGTLIWIDPVSRTYVIILTSRVHPYGKGDADPLRKQIMSLVSGALGPLSENHVLSRRPSLTRYYELMKSYRGRVQTGIDVLEKEKFAPLTGLRLGLVTNHSGLDSAGRRTIDLLDRAPDLKLVALFSPEHGLSGTSDDKVLSTMDTSTGLPVYSLYGDTLRPAEKMLDGLDALVFDIQDIGVRFYTYITTMGYALEAAAKRGLTFYVLDRPNPLTGSSVQGPVMDRDLKSFTGYFPLPVRHGMTIGELAQMFNDENKIRARLHIIKMNGYRRTYWYDETGLPWVNPSPNVRSITEAILYSAVAMVEGSNVSAGRGTDTPFELLGAPWIHAEEFTTYLNNRKIKGVRFIPVDFTPDNNMFKNHKCHGARIILEDRNSLDAALLGIEIVSALYRLYPGDFRLDKTLDIIGSRKVVQAIRDGLDPKTVTLQWSKDLERFKKLRSKYLLY